MDEVTAAEAKLVAAIRPSKEEAIPPTALRQPRWTAGRHGNGLELTAGEHLDAGSPKAVDFGYFDKFSLSAWVYPTKASGTILSKMTPGPRNDGYYLQVEDRRVQLNLVKRWLDDSLRVEAEQPLALNQWTHVLATYDGSRESPGVRIYINGRSSPFQVRQPFINQTFTAPMQPLRIGGGASAFEGRLDDVRIYNRALSPEEARMVALPISMKEFARLPGDLARLGAEEPAAFAKFRQLAIQERNLPAVKAVRQSREAELALEQYIEQLPTLMVMQEMETPRKTHVLNRGEYDQYRDEVQPATPATLHALPASARRDRLGLAQWLVAKENPLTARVLANRLWQLHFGVGLVKSAEDFGVQGERPTHPRLLDFLATELMRRGWKLQSIQKLIVTSATYRQSSNIRTAAARRQSKADPDNRLLWRGPRNRLPAEMVRDQALAVSGLLKHRLGGPSVRPYQPAGLWKEIATDTDYQQSHGDDLYRRSLYTYWKRTVAPPTMTTLDATSRETCTVKRSRTNTPLQALALMNEVSFVEAARGLAQRTVRQAGAKPKARIEFLFRTSLARRPRAEEARVLLAAYQHHLKTYRNSPADAASLLAQGELPLPKELDTAELAALTMVCSLVLNLDEMITLE